MKTVQEIKTELEAIKSRFAKELNEFIKENPNIVVYLDFQTETEWVDIQSGERLLAATVVTSNLNISVI